MRNTIGDEDGDQMESRRSREVALHAIDKIMEWTDTEYAKIIYDTDVDGQTNRVLFDDLTRRGTRAEGCVLSGTGTERTRQSIPIKTVLLCSHSNVCSSIVCLSPFPLRILPSAFFEQTLLLRRFGDGSLFASAESGTL